MRSILNLYFAMGFILLVGASPAMAERRIALVIGNSAYEKTATLANPGSDAKAMSESLTRLGFEVISGYDLTRLKFERLIRTFSKKLRGADVGLLYYAGHGMQVSGQNYLVPVDAELESEDDIDFTMIELNTILKRMERYAKINLVFLDACRNNPYLAELVRSMGKRGDRMARGFASVKFRNESLIVYATQPGYVADDGKGRHSPFTRALLDHIETPGLDIRILMRKVRANVKRVTKGLQIPWDHSSLTEAFLFKAIARKDVTIAKRTPKLPSSKGVSAQLSEARLAWIFVKDSKDPSQLENFIKHFKNTFYATLAKQELKKLREKKVAVIAPAKTLAPKMSKPKIAPIHDCDRLAAQPDDSEKVTDGVEVEELNADDAILFCRKAVKIHPNVARFAYQLGRAHHKGKSYQKARIWYEKGMVQGSAAAISGLGQLYRKGRGVPKNYKKAEHLFRKAIERDSVAAMHNLGVMYEKGEGVKQDYGEAVRLYQQAAAKGSAVAMNNLGVMYYNGQGVDKDHRKAVKWYFKAADKKNTAAYYNLAIAHENGEGVAKDRTAAAGYMFKALRGGNDFSVKQMTSNAGELSLAFRKELQRLMASEGVYSGAIDGQFGSGTKRAIRVLAKQP